LNWRADPDSVPVKFAAEIAHETKLALTPRGFTKIRHFGLYASSNVNTKLPVARACIDAGSTQGAPATPRPLAWYELLLSLTGRDPTRCPRCGHRLILQPLPRLVAKPGPHGAGSHLAYRDTS